MHKDMVKNAKNVVDLFQSFKGKKNMPLFLAPIVPMAYICLQNQLATDMI